MRYKTLWKSITFGVLASLVSSTITPEKASAFTKETHKNMTEDLAKANELVFMLETSGISTDKAKDIRKSLKEGSSIPDKSEKGEINPDGCQQIGDAIGRSEAAADPDHWYPANAISIPPWMPVPDEQECGKAPENAKRFYERALNKIEQGQLENGFKLLGRALHYPQDMGVPHHTVGVGSLVKNNGRTGHYNYEVWVEENYSDIVGSDFRSQVSKNNGIVTPSALKSEVKEIAKQTSKSYASINKKCQGQECSASFSDTKKNLRNVARITDRMLELAISKLNHGGGGSGCGGGSSSEPFCY